MPHLKLYLATDAAYKASCCLPEPTDLDGTVEASQRLVDRIMRSKWWSDNAPPSTHRRATVKLTESMPDTWLGKTEFDMLDLKKKPIIYIRPEAAKDYWTITHELAHVLTWRVDAGRHASPFVRNHFILVRDWVSPEHAALFKQKLIEHKVRAPYRDLILS